MTPSFETFLQGASTGASPGGPAQGSFSVDMTLAHRLDPIANPAEGQVVAGWNVGVDQRDVHVHLTDVHAGSDAPATADVGSQMKADGSGTLAFDALSSDATRVRSRWNPSGAGRADVEAQDGDAGTAFLVTECWDSSFERVYALGRTPDGGVASEGDASACAFSEPLQ